jgi:hypothetical protein
MLFAAHLGDTLGNAGKVAVMNTPMAISYPQWVAFFKYSVQQLAWGLHGREKERASFVQQKLDAGWDALDAGLTESCGNAFGEPLPLGHR